MGALLITLLYGFICLQLLLAVTSVTLAAIGASVDGERTKVVPYYFTGFVLAFLHAMNVISRLDRYTKCKLTTVLNEKILKLLRSKVIRRLLLILPVMWGHIGLFLLGSSGAADDTSDINAEVAKGLSGCHIISFFILFFSIWVIDLYEKERMNIQLESDNQIEQENPAQKHGEENGNLTGQAAGMSYSNAKTEFSPLKIDENRLHANEDELKQQDIMIEQSDDGDPVPFVISMNPERPPPPAYNEVISMNI